MTDSGLYIIKKRVFNMNDMKKKEREREKERDWIILYFANNNNKKKNSKWLYFPIVE
jgi:allantoicase